MKRHDRALRLAVADLAVQPQAEIDAVLAALSEGQSHRITALLAELRGGPAPEGFGHFSPWLARRIEHATPMTGHAARALLECARTMTFPREKLEPSRPPSLLGRVGEMLKGQSV